MRRSATESPTRCRSRPGLFYNAVLTPFLFPVTVFILKLLPVVKGCCNYNPSPGVVFRRLAQFLRDPVSGLDHVDHEGIWGRYVYVSTNALPEQ